MSGFPPLLFLTCITRPSRASCLPLLANFPFSCSDRLSDDDQARELFRNTLANRHPFSDLAAMDVGESTKGLRVAGVPTGDDTWVTKFVAEKVEAVILDIVKIDHVLTDGIIHYHMLRFCQNTRPGFLARNTPNT